MLTPARAIVLEPFLPSIVLLSRSCEESVYRKVLHVAERRRIQHDNHRLGAVWRQACKFVGAAPEAASGAAACPLLTWIPPTTYNARRTRTCHSLFCVTINGLH